MNLTRRPGIRPQNGPKRFPDWASGPGQEGFGKTRPRMHAHPTGGLFLWLLFSHPQCTVLRAIRAPWIARAHRTRLPACAARVVASSSPTQ